MHVIECGVQVRVTGGTVWYGIRRTAGAARYVPDGYEIVRSRSGSCDWGLCSSFVYRTLEDAAEALYSMVGGLPGFVAHPAAPAPFNRAEQTSLVPDEACVGEQTSIL
jgi:hypothetical protein